MRFRSIVLASAAFALLAGGVIAADAVHGIDTAAMDTSVKPGDDFYAYANGNWMKTAEIPPDLPSWGSFGMLAREVQLRNRGLMEDAANASEGSEARKVGDYYASFMDEAAIEKAGLTPLKSELDRIGAIKDASGLAAQIGASQRIDVDPLNNTNFHTDHLFGMWVAPGFSADCLETLEEIAGENAHIFTRNGGENFVHIPCLNDSEPGMLVIWTVVLRELKGWV